MEKREKMNKKGFIRTLESLIAIILLLVFVIYIYNGNATKIEVKIPEIVENANEYIINEFLNNNLYRNCFSKTNSFGLCSNAFISDSTLNNCWDNNPSINPDTNINSFLKKAMPPGYTFSCEILQDQKSFSTLPLETKDKSVYPKSGLIYSEQNQQIRVVRVYIYPI